MTLELGKVWDACIIYFAGAAGGGALVTAAVDRQQLGLSLLLFVCSLGLLVFTLFAWNRQELERLYLTPEEAAQLYERRGKIITYYEVSAGDVAGKLLAYADRRGAR